MEPKRRKKLRETFAFALMFAVIGATHWLHGQAEWEPAAVYEALTREGDLRPGAAGTLLLFVSSGCQACERAVRDFGRVAGGRVDRIVVSRESRGVPIGARLHRDVDGRLRHLVSHAGGPLYLLYDGQGRFLEARRGRKRPSVLTKWVAGWLEAT